MKTGQVVVVAVVIVAIIVVGGGIFFWQWNKGKDEQCAKSSAAAVAKATAKAAADATAACSTRVQTEVAAAQAKAMKDANAKLAQVETKLTQAETVAAQAKVKLTQAEADAEAAAAACATRVKSEVAAAQTKAMQEANDKLSQAKDQLAQAEERLKQAEIEAARIRGKIRQRDAEFAQAQADATTYSKRIILAKALKQIRVDAGEEAALAAAQARLEAKQIADMKLELRVLTSKNNAAIAALNAQIATLKASINQTSDPTVELALQKKLNGFKAQVKALEDAIPDRSTEIERKEAKVDPTTIDDEVKQWQSAQIRYIYKTLGVRLETLNALLEFIDAHPEVQPHDPFAGVLVDMYTRQPAADKGAINKIHIVVTPCAAGEPPYELTTYALPHRPVKIPFVDVPCQISVKVVGMAADTSINDMPTHIRSVLFNNVDIFEQKKIVSADSPNITIDVSDKTGEGGFDLYAGDGLLLKTSGQHAVPIVIRAAEELEQKRQEEAAIQQRIADFKAEEAADASRVVKVESSVLLDINTMISWIGDWAKTQGVDMTGMSQLNMVLLLMERLEHEDAMPPPPPPSFKGVVVDAYSTPVRVGDMPTGFAIYTLRIRIFPSDDSASILETSVLAVPYQPITIPYTAGAIKKVEIMPVGITEKGSGCVARIRSVLVDGADIFKKQEFLRADGILVNSSCEDSRDCTFEFNEEDVTEGNKIVYETN